jgi:hypothetical protein
LHYSPGSLTTDHSARRAAQDFANLVGAIVNTTVSRAPISFLEVQGPEFEGFVAHRSGRVPVAMPLQNGRHLFIYHKLGLRREERFLTTLEYKYQLSGDGRRRLLDLPVRVPARAAGRLSLSARPRACERSAGELQHQQGIPRLHLPTGTRVRIEDVVRHLLDEHEVPAISSNWQAVLAAAEADFAEIQRRRIVG